jgi:hypothetical protein
MEYGTETTDLQVRIKRLENQLKAFRFTFVIVCLALGSQFWLQTRPKAIQTAATVQARKFEVVDEAGEAVGELSRKDGGAHLVLYDASHKPVEEFSVAGPDPSIVFYDAEQKQRAILGMLAGAPTLAMHDAKGDVRSLLTAQNNGSIFWVKDKNGFATILGNPINETQKIERADGKDIPHDTVETTSGASIRIQDARRKVLWKAP